MKTMHSQLTITGAAARSTQTISSVIQQKLRGITEIELRAWRRAVQDRSILNYEFFDLNEIFDYPFKDHDQVWVHIKEDDQWCLGRVAGRNIRIGQTFNRKEGFYYPVIFGHGKDLQIRKYFSPLNGEMKPDTEEIREMLMRGGWLYNNDFSDVTSSEDSGSDSNYTDSDA